MKTLDVLKLGLLWSTISLAPGGALIMYQLGRSTEALILGFLWVLAALLLIDGSEEKERA